MEHEAHIDYGKLLYERSDSTFRVHGILSIIFGSLGVLMAIVMTFLFIGGTYSDPSYDSVNSPLGLFVVGSMIFVFWTLPHLYLIISGYYLMHEPSPKVAKTLTIINLIIGVFWNLVLLIFAIISLTQFSDYERGYQVYKKK